eukprot:TRINITY_DN33543_c0_g1_i1.p1 TRINITY_DN33543_c0_g1~~TRINITY_DN33543_c0_g1_i1.p1  ORF type:complete len:329 (+),score=45.49 TRINITY_DN33543_c0_g1_i1:78-989(+)
MASPGPPRLASSGGTPVRCEVQSGQPAACAAPVWLDATKRALNSGVAGMGTQAVNVCLLMWMRTIMQYQYRHGGTIGLVARRLWAEGGAMRFYRGLGPALVLAPASRFCDTAANDGCLAVLEPTGLSIYSKTLAASFWAALLRLGLLPVDAWATMKQVEGRDGFRLLVERARKRPTSLWHGAGSAFCGALVGHYTWFLTCNLLFEASLPYKQDLPPWRCHLQNAGIGFLCGACSDVCSNSFYVLKTIRQTSAEQVGYSRMVRWVIESEGLSGLFGRGLRMRVLTNGVQGALFTVGWKAMSACT